MWNFYFGWYQGAVYSNLLASGLCAGLVWWRARVHLKRHARKQTELHEETRRVLGQSSNEPDDE